jgi:hypothetical protein
MKHYILKAREVVEIDMIQWAKWFKQAGRIVARTKINKKVEVSTVFLGIDHQLFETLPFRIISQSSREGLEHFMRRYSTWSQALQGHNEVCEEVRLWLSSHGEYQENE